MLQSPATSSALRAAVLAVSLACANPEAHAHALLQERVTGEAVMLHLHYGWGDEKPWFEPYEVFAPGSERPFQKGYVNEAGEVSFRPDRPGRWTVRVATEDGHGAQVEIEVDAAGLARIESGASLPVRVGSALGYLAGVFGIVALWVSRRKAGTIPTEPSATRAG